MRNFPLPLVVVSTLLYSDGNLGVEGGDITFRPQKARKVVFSHDFHVTDLGLTCQKCHPDLYKMIKGKDKPVTIAPWLR